MTPLFPGALLLGRAGSAHGRTSDPSTPGPQCLLTVFASGPVQAITLAQAGRQCPLNGWKWKNRYL